MVERHRSKDGSKDTDRFRDSGTGGGSDGGPGGKGRSGGNLARDIGTEDELKRSKEQPAGVTRVTKSDEKERAEKKDSGR